MLKTFAITATHEKRIIFKRDFRATDKKRALSLAEDVAYFELIDKGATAAQSNDIIEEMEFDYVPAYET